MRILIFLLVYCVSLVSCKSSSKQDDPQNKMNIKNDSSKTKVIHLYKVEPAFLSYMPDTSLTFTSSKALSDYLFVAIKRFDSIKAKLELIGIKDKNLIVLANNNASILFDDLMGVLYFKFYKSAPKNNQNMGLLSFYSPYSKIIPLKERLDFYYTFPEKIQKNEIGKKTLTRLTDYTFTRNIGFSLHKFDNLEILSKINEKAIFKNIFVPQYKYYILAFGASWCLPCRLGELQLKYWVPLIDTSEIHIVGLSIDKDIDKWEKYLEEDKLPWNSYLLKGEMNNEIVKQLKFETIPRNFLLDSTGKILAENVDIRKILKQIPILNTE